MVKSKITDTEKNEVIQKYRLNDSYKEHIYNYAGKSLRRVNLKHLIAAKYARYSDPQSPLCLGWDTTI